MPQFPGSLTDAQADAIIANLFKWVSDRSQVAAIVCDAVHSDITLQPLHDAYARYTRSLAPFVPVR